MENMTFNEMDQAIADAEQTLRRADTYTLKMARIVIKRLHLLPSYELIKLKRQLNKFNSKTGEWKN